MNQKHHWKFLKNIFESITIVVRVYLAFFPIITGVFLELDAVVWQEI